MNDDLSQCSQKISKMNVDMDLLFDLEQKDLETLIAVIRDRIDQEKKFLSQRR